MADKIARVAVKLEESLKAGDYYGALQMYRTIIKRKVDAGSLDEAQDLVVQGAGMLSTHGKANEAADLGDMLLKTYAAQRIQLAQSRVDAVKSISAAFPATGAVAQVNFLRAALHWAQNAPKPAAAAGAGSSVDVDEEMSTSDAADEAQTALLAQLRLVAARACAAAGDEFYGEAQRHYLEANVGTEFGAFLYTVASGTAYDAGKASSGASSSSSGSGQAGGGSQAKVGGYASERDLFLARAVLQLLCLGNLKDANAVRDEYLRKWEEQGVKLDSPLVHFIKFLLLTLERDAAPLFKLLVDKYKPSLSRDESFLDYCTTIGFRWFDIRPPQNGMGNLMSMMQNMLGGAGGGGPPGRGGPAGGGMGGLASLLGGMGGGGGGMPPFPFPAGMK